MIKTYSSGGIVLNNKGQVLVVNQHNDSWSLPKGHIDPGENERQAAAREIEEESGITDLKFLKEVGTYQRYRIGKNGVGDDKSDLKTITLFLYKTSQEDLNPSDPDNPEARWVEINNVSNLLTHPKDKQFFKANIETIKNSAFLK